MCLAMRWIKRIAIGLLVVVLAFGIFGIWTVRRSFPQVSGELEVAGLNESVEVVRDDWGVPHIYARNAHDLFMAQGYTHAQERFWQMDFWRHIGSARLSEMFGESQLGTDEFLRSLDFAGLAEQELEMMDEGLSDILQWYADGVNAYLSENDGAEISLEYAVLPLQNSGYEVEPWEPIHTLTWAKMMAWDLGGNMRAEIARAVLSAELPIDRVEQLYPRYPDDHPVIVEPDQMSADASRSSALLIAGSVDALASVDKAARAVWDLTGGGFDGIGSNNWVVGGSMTQSGIPLLSNDTHLGIQMPSIWFENALHCVEDTPDCPYNVIGFTFAGVPGVVIGHNERIAWGVTNQAIDAQDLFIERVNPDNPDQYEVEGEWVDFDVRTEVIEVAGGEPVTLDVRSTRHGPVISGTFLEEGELDDTRAIPLPEDYVVALSWTALSPSTLVEAIIGLNTAENYDDFRATTSKWDIAAQNVVYADVEGNIAYQSTGEVPVRAGGDGRYPVPGWTTEYDWVGYVPFEEMPSLFNPPQGFIETANQPVNRQGRLPFIGVEGAYGYRASRIQELIEARSDHTVRSMHEIQFDNRDGGAVILIPHLLEIDPRGATEVEEVQSRLRIWEENDGFQVEGESSGAAIYQGVWRHVLANIFHDELPEDYWPEGGSRWFEVVEGLLAEPDDPYWDDASTSGVESREDVLHKSMLDAHGELSDVLGDEPDEWSWGQLHVAHFENQTFGQSGIGPIEWLFNRTAPERVAGSESIVNAVGWDTNESYVVDWVPSERMVVDLADFTASTFIHTTGQSGHAFHPFYDNMIEPWTDGDHAPMYWTRTDVDENTSSTLTLIPDRG
jgi:penicillin amidase